MDDGTGFHGPGQPGEGGQVLIEVVAGGVGIARGAGGEDFVVVLGGGQAVGGRGVGTDGPVRALFVGAGVAAADGQAEVVAEIVVGAELDGGPGELVPRVVVPVIGIERDEEIALEIRDALVGGAVGLEPGGGESQRGFFAGVPGGGRRKGRGLVAVHAAGQVVGLVVGQGEGHADGDGVGQDLVGVGGETGGSAVAEGAAEGQRREGTVEIRRFGDEIDAAAAALEVALAAQDAVEGPLEDFDAGEPGGIEEDRQAGGQDHAVEQDVVAAVAADRGLAGADGERRLAAGEDAGDLFEGVVDGGDVALFQQRARNDFHGQGQFGRSRRHERAGGGRRRMHGVGRRGDDDFGEIRHGRRLCRGGLHGP